MYNTVGFHTSYKPYVPLPKKKAGEKSAFQGETKGKAITPDDYSEHNGKDSSSDTFNKSQIRPAKININQLLIDFNSTLNAIGASEDVENEVKTYLSLVEHQSRKDVPNKKMIISNLKIAADVLDEYISDTLKKPSKLTKDWVEALLSLNIDFKADESVTKGAFEAITGEPQPIAKVAEKKLAEKQLTQSNIEIIDAPQEITENIPPKEIEQVEKPDNTRVLNLISQAEQLKTKSVDSALKVLSEAFAIAQSIEDKSSMAKVYSSIAKVQNQVNNLSKALDCFHASTVIAYSIGDEKLKTENHKQMGKIYDDAGYFEPAISHYYASIAIDGNLDDSENQADTLNSIGKMYTQKYITDEAVEYYKDALDMAKVTKNLDIMSNIFTNTAITFGNVGDNTKAMDNLKQAAILSKKSGNKENLSGIYEQAADLMENMNYTNRAKDLYTKSYRLAQQINDDESIRRLKEKIVALSE